MSGRHLLRCIELALLIPAFGILIPAVPSEAGERYGLFPGLAYGVILFAISLALAVRRGGEHWLPALVKLVMFCGLGWLIHVRVWF